MRLPNDLEILDHLFETYADEFLRYDLEVLNRETVVYVPIDIRKAAKSLETDPQILFGRLYYHLDHKYRYKQDDDAMVHLFARTVGFDNHCVNYPYLAAIVSEKRTEDNRNKVAILLSVLALLATVAQYFRTA